MAKARLRPKMAPILPPVIISEAMTSVYRRDRRLDAGDVGTEILRHRGDRDVHDRAVQGLGNCAAARVTSTVAPAEPTMVSVLIRAP
jgi:hypothetical protein